MTVGLAELRAVSVAARLGSLSRAAEVLNITQPALSRRIAEAERALGVILFDRLPRGVRPTVACIAFLEHAEIALTSIDEGKAAAIDARDSTEHKISIAFLEPLCDDHMITACRETVQRFTRAAVDFRSCNWSAEVSAAVMSGTSKIGLRYRRDPRPQLESVWVADDPIAIACSASHPLAKAGWATIEQLEQCYWIGSPAAIDRTFASHQDGIVAGGFQKWKTTDVHTIYARIRLMKAGTCLALIRRSCIEDEIQAGNVVDLKTPLTSSIPIFLAWRRGAFLNEAAQYLADRLRRSYISAAPDHAATAMADLP